MSKLIDSQFSEQEKQYTEASKRISILQKASINVPGGYHRCAISKGYPFLFVSKSFEQLVGYTQKQLKEELENKFINLVLPEDLKRFSEYEKKIKENGNADFTYRIVRRDGEVRWIQDSSLSIDWDGKLCLQRTIADITDFIREQENFAKQKAEFDELVEHIPCGYHRCTIDGGFLLDFVSENFLETVGYEKNEALGMPFINLVHPEDRKLFLSHEPQLINEGKVELMYRIVRKDGKIRWVKDSTTHVKHAGKEYYQCILTDITSFVSKQEKIMKRNIELMQKETMLDTIEKNMPGGYHRCSAEKGCPITFMGDYFLDIIGYTREEVAEKFGNLYKNLLWHEDVSKIEKYENMFKQQTNNNIYDTTIYRLNHKDGGYRWVTDSTMLVKSGKESFFQSSISDITEYIEGLNSAKKEAEASNLAKSTFLFNASHDIRTPMNAIKGFAHIIKENVNDPDKIANAIEKIEMASDTLMTLMNDILDLSRIERGKEVVNAKPVYLNKQGKNLYEMFASSMENSGINFNFSNKVKHQYVLCDELKISRIVMNMLSNAKKFTPRGGSVTFGAEELSFDGENVTIRFFTKDTGIGMSEEFKTRAFEQFERAQSSTESGVSGSGLGLSIIKQFVDLMNGEVNIESELGHGTEISVTITFPVIKEKQQKDLPKNTETANISGKRVLLVEDNEFNREIARYILEEMGLYVDEAENGVVCLAKLTSNPAKNYDLVLMDIRMPIMNGYKTTREIRRLENPKTARIPIIAMTANAFEEDKKKCFAVGMDGHIGKPIDTESVIKELTRILAL